MPKAIVFRTTHLIQFSDLDPYNHMGTGKYATYYVDHTAGKNVSRCLMTVAHVDQETNRATDWPADHRAPFFERETT